MPLRRRALRLTLGSVAAAAAAAIALVLLVGTAGSGGPATADAAIIHRATEAVTPLPDQILHTKVVGEQAGVPVMAESWQETSAPFASRGAKGEPGRQGEFGDNGQTTFEYDPSTNTITEQPDSTAPSFADPLSQVRSELAGGQALLAGTVVIGGVALFKVDLPHGLVGYFDQTDYRPRYFDDPQRDGSVVRLRIEAYEYLPMTAANRALLSVTAQHPGARVVTAASASNGAAGK